MRLARCLFTVSTLVRVSERESDRERSMVITVHFSGEQMGSFACIFQINPQFD